MKTLVLILFLYSCVASVAQVPEDSLIKVRNSVKIIDTIQIDSLKANNIKADTTMLVMPFPVRILRTDTSVTPALNSYGGLVNDDPFYNPRYPLLVPASRVILADAFTWAVDRYIFNYDWARISPSTWKSNLRNGWEWDNDKFGINFIGHPHSGNVYFNIARSNGYSFWQSFPFAVEGSLIWEYFGENARPSINDIINTPVSGAFLGEVVYRISSNILDDRTRGAERFFREFFAGIMNPPRALNRLTQGKMFRVTMQEVYQKEPLNIILSGGIHKVNENNKFGSGGTNAILNLQLDYGDPFEIRHRKPFDIFRLRIESKYGTDRKLLDNVLGYGFLFGKNVTKGKFGMLAGVFQQFDYWNNNILEVGSLGFGPGIISRVPLGKNSNLYSALHLAAVPLAGNNTRFGPDSSELRNYNFGGGFEGRIEETLNLSKWITMGFSGYYYWIHTYVGLPGNSFLGILKPKITIKLFGNTSLGFEHSVYYHDRFPHNELPTLRLTQTEQKIFLQVFLEDPKRRGKYH